VSGDADIEGKWIRRVETSGLLERIEGAVAAANSAMVESETEVADRNRVVAVLGIADQTLRAADPEVVREAALAEITSHLDTIVANLNACAGAPSPPNLASALQALDPVLAALSTLYVPRSFDEGGEVIAKFKQSVTASRAAITRQLDELADRIKALEVDADARLAAIATEVEAASTSIATATAQFQQLQLTAQNAFDEAQTSRTTEFDKQLKDQRSESEAAATRSSAALAELRETQTARMNEIVDSAESSNRRIDEILGLVGEKGLVGRYAETADSERKLAFRWRVAASVVAAGAIGVAVVAAARHTDQGWQAIVPKLTLTLLIGALAAYCGSVANDHRKAEKQARELGLQLAAIKPYLNDLSDDGVRDAVLSVVAIQLFKGGDGSGLDTDAIKSVGAAGQLGDLLLDQLGKALLAKK
jgi:hypothetical protein